MNLNIFGEKAVTGLQERRNVLTYVLILAGPFYVIFGFGFMLDMAGAGPEWVLMEMALGIAMWIAGTYGYHANRKMELASMKCFDSAKVKLDESTVQTLDLIFPDSSIKYLGKTKKEREIWEIGPFTNIFGYNHPTEGWIEWNSMFVLLPFPKIPWDETFFFQGHGELWFKNIPCESPNCESATFHVSPNWINRDGEWIPVALVADSFLHYFKTKERMLEFQEREITIKTTEVDDKGKTSVKEETLELPEDPIYADEIIEARLIVLSSENTNLKISNRRLQEQRDSLLNEKAIVVREQVDDELNAIKKRHRKISRAKPSMGYKFINMKTFAIILTILVILGIIYVFATG